MFFIWLIVNTVGVNTVGGWGVALLSSVLAAGLFTSFFTKKGTIIVKKKSPVLSGFFLILLFISFFYIVYPAVQHPFVSLGIPNKDVHDGISAYIADYGATPSRIFPKESDFIMNSHDRLYLDYPNVMHSVAGLFIGFGVSIFSATWIVYAIMLSLVSCAVLLLFHIMERDDILATLLAGLFPITSFRIWYTGVASIPMGYSFALLIIVLSLWLFLVKHRNFRQRYLVFGMSGAALAASYSGTILVLVGVFVLLFLLSKTTHRHIGLSNLLQDILLSTPFIAIGFLLQGAIYWQNTFPTSVDFDPYELSQRLMPVDDVFYMYLFIVAFCVFIWQITRNRLRSNHASNIFEWIFAIVGLGLMGFVIYDIMFHMQLGSFSPEDLVGSPASGVWSGLNHQKISRLALLQPFFWILCAHIRIDNTIGRRGVALLIGIALLYHASVSVIPTPYNPIQVELYDSFYNDKNNISFLDSVTTGRMRLVYNPYIWNQDIKKQMDVLKNGITNEDKVLLIDGREWTEETVADWAALYIRKPILRYSENETSIKETGVLIWGTELTGEQIQSYTSLCRQFLFQDDTSFICRQ